MVVNPTGETCRCGAQGCWETEIGRDAILRGAGLDGDRLEVVDVIAAAATGNRKAKAAIDRAGDWLGIGLANLVNLFNPEVIVLGGHLRLLFPLVSGTVYRRIHFALPATREQVRVEVPSLNGDSTLLGAAETAFEDLLSDPIDVLAASHRAVAS
jgi:predicted NBD/HSP70 family sugar kinase